MDENLISKKALLEKYGISYGALYRWKRKGLIPEDWFIKTGKETSFPRKSMTQLVEMLVSHREDLLVYEKLTNEFPKEEIIYIPDSKTDRAVERGSFDGRKSYI